MRVWQAYFRQQHKADRVAQPADLEARIREYESSQAAMEQRIDAMETHVHALQARFEVIHEQPDTLGATLPAQAAQSERTQTSVPVQQIYEGEWTITESSGTIRSHSQESRQARERLDVLMKRSPGGGWTLHPPVYLPSDAPATELTDGLQQMYKQVVLKSGEIVVFVNDFRLPEPEYWCEATHKDVVAKLALIPYKQGERGAYTIAQTKWEKIKKTGREGPAQILRGNKLLATLIDRTQREMRQCGWTEDEQAVWRNLH